MTDAHTVITTRIPGGWRHTCAGCGWCVIDYDDGRRVVVCAAGAEIHGTGGREG